MSLRVSYKLSYHVVTSPSFSLVDAFASALHAVPRMRSYATFHIRVSSDRTCISYNIIHQREHGNTSSFGWSAWSCGEQVTSICPYGIYARVGRGRKNRRCCGLRRGALRVHLISTVVLHIIFCSVLICCSSPY